MPPLVGQVQIGGWEYLLGIITRRTIVVDVAVSSAVMICDKHSGQRFQRRSRPPPHDPT